MNNILQPFQSAITGSWNGVWLPTVTVLPKILGAVILFALGLLIAVWVKKIIVKSLNLVKFEKLTTKIGIEGYLKKINSNMTFTEIVAVFVEWVLVLVFILASTEILGLTVVSAVAAQILAYIPNILAAALIFAVAFYISKLVGGLIKSVVAGVDGKIAKPAGNLARYLVLFIGFFAAIDQLKIAQSLVSNFFQGLTYTLVLVVGLSVGLGAKDLVSKILSDWYEKVKK
jgi:hypothetical protein